MLMITSHAYDYGICRWLWHMQIITTYADDHAICRRLRDMEMITWHADDHDIRNRLRLSRWLPYNYIDNNGTCKPLRHLQMIAWHADDYGIYADDHDIIMQMMICEEWEMYGAMTSPIETTEWKRWNINLRNTQIRAWLTNAFNWKRVQLSSWLEIIYFTGRWQLDAASQKKPDGRILRILPPLAIDFGADPWPSRSCIVFPRTILFSSIYRVSLGLLRILCGAIHCLCRKDFHGVCPNDKPREPVRKRLA